MIRIALVAAMLLALVGFAPTASADSVTWTLHNLVFDDGGTISGSFDYDAATNTLSNINDVTSNGTLFTGATYIAFDPGFGPFAFDFALVTNPSLSNYVGTPALEIDFFTDLGEPTFQNLANVGGTVITDINEFICTNANCSEATDIRGTATPAPSLES